jgi:hypothetical protein
MPPDVKDVVLVPIERRYDHLVIIAFVYTNHYVAMRGCGRGEPERFSEVAVLSFCLKLPSQI